MIYLHKRKCLNCGLHFIVCSWEAKKDDLMCPECGQKKFIEWLTETDQHIFQIVPGDSQLEMVGNTKRVSEKCRLSDEIPRYKCHKEVRALKIAQIDYRYNTEGTMLSTVITPQDDGHAAFTVPTEYIHKHNPQIGGYYVVYADGYKSFSPSTVFEEGYTAVEDEKQVQA